MTWRGSTDTKDRIFAALVYLLPLYSAFAFGDSIFQQIPFLGAALAIALYPLAFLYSSLGSFGSLIIFFVLFLAVVRNPRISHFIRFNTMQAILIDILVSLLRLVLDFVARGGANLVVETLFNVVFLGAFAACVYSIIQSFIGKYADIPTISEAAYSQVGG
ncbi:Tic20 family protein [Microcystis aeruginosa]|uniref:Tic20 family protein n=1 Tax=Microcystis aeruginosa TaxID=1126 RepID=UPI000261E179|nr:Tic20 family protein [Microcystis aeruginosa]CCI09441.1 Ycf60-like protein [Microcystis aeruginosa PCC 7941]